ncbi:MAG: Succinate dehydrogenase cytochrome b-556 subunit [uncultured Thiotrichaceae bacterium]|uniref:Succinate dehydrogenase cytochrome b556 subunit n=1 Tax=uncultured Thiotrichaceae bacterium TaxID=298394 RepID=A0A6S6SJA4_9GAMM|nr:MAG: Succinate dehydrogenase cytochrome b-556 subunit [uncultured Thiotrichaceae bacterium]
MSWDDKRPMSPHLQVYKLPLTAKLSIMHRGTGAALFAGLILMVLVLASAAGGADSWASMQGFLSSWFGKLVLFGFTFALYYHLCNGIRHLAWDIGKGFELKEAAQSGKIVIGASVALTILTWLLA